MQERIIENPYGFIYITTNLINGMRYIGQKKFNKDWKHYLGSGKYFRNAIKKYGCENFKRYIVDIAYSEDELNQKEQQWIKNYNAVESKDFYNIGDGGNGNPLSGLSEEKMKERNKKISESSKGKKMSEESKRKMSGSKKGIPKTEEFKQKLKNRIITEETKAKMSKTRKEKYSIEKHHMNGKKLSEETKQKMSIPIVQLSKDGCFFIAEYIGITEAHKQTNINLGHINSVCRGKRKTAGGFHWMYKTDYEQLNKAG